MKKHLDYGWSANVMLSPDTEINDNEEIHDNKSIHHFFDLIFGEHDIIPTIKARLSISLFNVDLNEGLFDVDLETKRFKILLNKKMHNVDLETKKHKVLLGCD